LKLQNSKIKNTVLINSYKSIYKTSIAQNKGESNNFGYGGLIIFANRGTGKIRLFGSRLYSNNPSSNINNNVKRSVDADIINSFQNEAITFDSLESGFEAIKFSMLGVSGVYLLKNTENPERFYIGSTVNLARRLSEYMLLTSGARKPQSISEVEISKTPSSK
jgi:hypothetical protein